MRKYLAILSILTCFIGCIFLLTAGGGGSSSKKPKQPHIPQLKTKIVQLEFKKFDKHYCACKMDNGAPLDPFTAACKIDPRRLSVIVIGKTDLSKMFNMKYSDVMWVRQGEGGKISEHCGMGSCLYGIGVPYTNETNEQFTLTCFYHEPYNEVTPCKTPYWEHSTCERWYFRDVFYSKSIDACGLPKQPIIIIEKENNPFRGKCGEYGVFNI